MLKKIKEFVKKYKWQIIIGCVWATEFGLPMKLVWCLW